MVMLPVLITTSLSEVFFFIVKKKIPKNVFIKKAKTEQTTHRDAQSFENVHLAHGTCAMIQQPRIHADLMK